MIVIFKNNANPEQVKQLCAGFEAQGLKIHNSEGRAHAPYRPHRRHIQRGHRPCARQ